MYFDIIFPSMPYFHTGLLFQLDYSIYICSSFQ